MVTFLSLSFWLYFIYFLFAIFVAFYLPGLFFARKLKLPKFSETILSFLIGMVFWGWQGYILGYLGIRWASYLYLLPFIIYWIKNYSLLTHKLRTIFIKWKIDYLLLLIIILGVFMQLTSVFFTGVQTPNGIYFCCGTVADNVLQISVTNEIAKNFPPYEPGMYPHPLQNYHYWDSLVIGELIRVFKLPLISTSYQYMTLFISLFLGLSAIVFSKILKIGKSYTRWLVFFLYFGGDFVWALITFFRGNDFFGMKPMESGQQFLENIPRATAVIVFFTFLSVFLLWIKRKDKLTGILMAFLAASLLGFKIYFGIFAFVGLGMLGFYLFFKKEFKRVLFLVFAVILGLIVYLPVNHSAGGLYFTGFWRLENFVVQPFFGTLGQMELARTIYTQHNNIPRIIEY